MTDMILLFTGEPAWTQRAAHLAAATARETGAAVLILRPAPVEHLGDLGAGASETLLSFADFDALQTIVGVVESYGVAAGVQLYEYTSYRGGIVSAAEQTAAVAVFAPAPTGPLAALDGLRLWALRRALRRPLYTLAEESGPWSIVGGRKTGLVTNDERRVPSEDHRSSTPDHRPLTTDN